MPVSYRMPAAERDQLMALAEPAAVLSDAQELKGITRAQMQALKFVPGDAAAGCGAAAALRDRGDASAR